MSALAPFVYNALASRVVFGQDTLSRLGVELARLGCQRALVLTTPEQANLAEKAKAAADGRAAGIFAGARMHTPVDVTEKALGMLREMQGDCLVSVGGGSTTGLAKALSLRTGLPQVAVPTTYAGSEMTPILGETQDGRKVTQRNEKLLPGTVIYDVGLSLSLPPALSVTSGMNAIAHAAEALYAQDANPVTGLMAEEGIRALASSLPAILQNSTDVTARSEALYGAWLCGVCLGTVGMALHHKLCHVLGGSFDLPHAETHTVILPYAMAYNAPAAPQAMQRIAYALKAENAAMGLWQLGTTLKAPRSLAALGVPADSIEKAADIALQNPYWNPRPLDRVAILALLRKAHAGEAPESI